MEKFKGILGGNAPIPHTSPLGCLLAHWKEADFGQELRKAKLIEYCNSRWPKYIFQDGKTWPENGSLQSDMISQLLMFCKQEGKLD